MSAQKQKVSETETQLRKLISKVGTTTLNSTQFDSIQFQSGWSSILDTNLKEGKAYK